MILNDLIARFRIQIRDTVPLVWTVVTAYKVGQVASNQGNAYQCIVPGISAASGGPAGIGTGITDGTVTWNYVGPAMVPALSDDEITQFITDGLRTYSLYRPRVRLTTISVVSGQAQYPLPNDWIDQVYASFEAATNPIPIIDPMSLSPFTFIASTELIARPMAYVLDVSYEFYPDDLNMIITPVPNSSYVLSFDYYALHAADSQGVSVPSLDVDLALLSGIAQALRSIATDYSVKLQRYKMGNNIEIDNKTIADNLGKRADEMDKRFERDIIKRPKGSAG